MRTLRIKQAVGIAVLAGLALSAIVTRAQTVDDYVVDQFGDDTGVLSWSRAWGLQPTFEWDPVENSGGNPDGALKVTIPFDILTYQGGDNQCAFQRQFTNIVDFEPYTKIHFDIKIDPSSGRRSISWGAGSFGGIDLLARNADWTAQPQITTSDPDLGVDDYGVWRHQAHEVDPTLTTHHNMSALMFHIWSGWWDGATQTGGLTNTVTFWVDNLYFEKNTNTAPVPPPSVSIKPATSGLQLIANQSASQWQRQGIRTVEDNKSWVGATGPVTYELTIKEAPLKDGFQAHMFLIPNSTGDTAPDWGNPDAACILIYDNGAGGGQINFGFKTNEANGNSQIYGANHLADLNSTTIQGTWKVTFENDTSVTLTTPDGGSTNFVMAAEAAAMFANPLTVYFGAQPGNLDYIGSGYVFSNVKVTGVPNPIDDSFTGADLDPLIWAKAAENTAGVLIAPPSAKCWLSWTLPAVGFGPQASSALVGAPWIELDLGKSFKSGSLQTMLLSAADLPAGNNAFLRMYKRPFTKLQVLMPGETAAPGTTTGKTGAPIAQGAGVPLDVIVNAVDDNWFLASVGRDVVNLTSTDLAAELPADAALVNGTRTFPVTLWSSGSWTITATDVTDPTKTANTGSSTTVP